MHVHSKIKIHMNTHRQKADSLALNGVDHHQLVDLREKTTAEEERRQQVEREHQRDNEEHRLVAEAPPE